MIIIQEYLYQIKPYIAHIQLYLDYFLFGMLQIIKNQLAEIINNIDAGNSNLSYEDQVKIFKAIQQITNKDTRMSKRMACDYLGKSRATFDNYVKLGLLPKGIKEDGFKELSWNKSDLDIFINNHKEYF